MLALLSPAKKLAFDGPLPTPNATDPELIADTAVVAALARALSTEALAAAMDLSDDLASLTWQRFQDFTVDPGGRPALFTFAGDVYQGLDAGSLSADAALWAQDRVRILSGLYGVLRPLDRIRAYRLEMGTKLANPRGKDLVTFWRAGITDALARAVADHADRTVLNLASDEYFAAVDTQRLGARVVTPVFQDVKDGKARALFLFVKRARGRAVRWLVDQRADRAEALRDADLDGYRYDAEASGPDRWVFRRPQPPPMGPRRGGAKRE